MSSKNIDRLVDEFKVYIDQSIKNHKPVVPGVKGTPSYLQGKLNVFYRTLIKCSDEVNRREDRILNNFTEEQDGERPILSEKLSRAKAGFVGKFKREHW